MKAAFDPKRTVKLWLIVLALAIASPFTGYASFALIVWYATTGRGAVICALAMSWTVAMLNPGLASEPPGANFLRFLVLGCAALSVGLRNSNSTQRARASRQVVLALLVGIGLILHSIALSSFVAVSVLKATSWSIAIVTSISAWRHLSAAERQSVVGVLYTGLRILMLASIPLLVVGPGYLTNGTGFQGVMGHPQAFGPTMALLAVWAFDRVLKAPRMPWRDFLVLVISLLFIYRSEARTAAGAFVLGVGAAFALSFVRDRRNGTHRAWGPHVVPILIGGVLTMLIAGLTAPERFEDFIAKRGETGADLGSAYDRSRGELIEVMLDNIEHHFWTGIGFGVASDPGEMMVLYDPVFALPISAVVEKGVMPLAVLEEVGFFGATLVGVWLLAVLWRASRVGFLPISTVVTALALNLGEAVLFSPSGMGMILLILIGWAVTEEVAR